MRNFFCRFLMFALLVQPVAYSTAETPPPWPFDVTPTGTPRFVWPLLRFQSPEFTDGLSLAHDMSFDGKNYSSRIVIPELNSYLVKRDHGAYYWRNPANGEMLLKPNEGTGPWRLTEAPDGTMRIDAEKGEIELVYANTQLVEMTRDRRRYNFNYAEGRLGEISRLETGGDQTLLVIKYNTDGQIESIEAGDKDFVCEYDEKIFLKKITEIGAKRSADFGYKNRLLTSARFMEKTTTQLTFEWGGMRSLSPFTLATPLPPVVVADRQSSYSIQRDPAGLQVVFRSKTDPANGGAWVLDSKNGMVKIKIGRQ